MFAALSRLVEPIKASFMKLYVCGGCQRSPSPVRGVQRAGAAMNILIIPGIQRGKENYLFYLVFGQELSLDSLKTWETPCLGRVDFFFLEEVLTGELNGSLVVDECLCRLVFGDMEGGSLAIFERRFLFQTIAATIWS